MGRRKLGSVPSGGETPALPADLHHCVADARRAAVALRLAEAENAYRLALLVGAATGRRLGHEGSAIEACAKMLGVARSTLQPFAIIAVCWSPQELRTLFGYGDRSLSVSHLLIAARLPRPARDQWLERVHAERLGVHEFRRRLKDEAAEAVG